MTDLRTVSNRDLDADGILHRCQWSVPVNCDVDHAIKASLKAFAPPWDHKIAYHALRAVILAAPPSLEASQRQIDYIASLPDIAWWGSRQARRRTRLLPSAGRSLGGRPDNVGEALNLSGRGSLSPAAEPVRRQLQRNRPV